MHRSVLLHRFEVCWGEHLGSEAVAGLHLLQEVEGLREEVERVYEHHLDCKHAHQADCLERVSVTSVCMDADRSLPDCTGHTGM